MAVFHSPNKKTNDKIERAAALPKGEATAFLYSF
jgi:hypothetical protein